MDWRNCSQKRVVLVEVQKCIPGREILYLYLIYINIDISRQHFTEVNRVQINSKTKQVTMSICFCLGERCKFPRKILLEWGRERHRADTCEPQNWESTDFLSLSDCQIPGQITSEFEKKAATRALLAPPDSDSENFLNDRLGHRSLTMGSCMLVPVSPK